MAIIHSFYLYAKVQNILEKQRPSRPYIAIFVISANGGTIFNTRFANNRKTDYGKRICKIPYFSLQKMAFYSPKEHLPQAKRPPFAKRPKTNGLPTIGKPRNSLYLNRL